jgi:2-amino-4-hydroxy-6-hydroxymethyldihydropteridine diphosphokinase
VTRRVRTYIGLGSNVGDSRRTIDAALRALDAVPGVRVRGVSPLYRTTPVGVTDQPDFLNAVVALDAPAERTPDTAAVGLLHELKRIERELGRQKRERWGPREIDLDLLVFGRHQLVLPELTVPHPRARERLFVLAPLADLAPGLQPPGWGERVRTARDRRRAIEGENAVRRVIRSAGS